MEQKKNISGIVLLCIAIGMFLGSFFTVIIENSMRQHEEKRMQTQIDHKILFANGWVYYLVPVPDKQMVDQKDSDIKFLNENIRRLYKENKRLKRR